MPLREFLIVKKKKEGKKTKKRIILKVGLAGDSCEPRH
jgi:hypothetical protein